MTRNAFLFLILLPLQTIPAFLLPPTHPFLTTLSSSLTQPTTLPDSLDDSAIIASEALLKYWEDAGSPSRCRVDFDTSVGDETYTKLKSSTEFMQKLVTGVCCAMIPGVLEERQREVMECVRARTELMNETEEEPMEEEKKEELMQILKSGGRSTEEWNGPKARIYFPDEGNAALAKRDWIQPLPSGGGGTLVPSCVEFSSLGGVQGLADTSKDMITFFFCPQASESDYVEEILYKSETSENLKLSIFINPNLVDMGVTGYGMAGRMLRERLIDGLVNVYYLRTLQWGALTRVYPNGFSVWQEDENEKDGYRLIKVMDRLPSNPEVEDIYDELNAVGQGEGGPGFFGAIGDFIDGMTKL